MPAVVSLEPGWLQHEDEGEEHEQHNQQHSSNSLFTFSTSSPPISAESPSSASPLSPFSSLHLLSSTPSSASHWLFLAASVVLVSSLLSLLFVSVAALCDNKRKSHKSAVASVERFRSEKSPASFASSFSSTSPFSPSLPPPLFQQKTASSQDSTKINDFSEKYKTEDKPIVKVKASEGETDDQTPRAFTLTDAAASTPTPPFTPNPFAFTRPPTHAPAFPLYFSPLNYNNYGDINVNSTNFSKDYFPKRLRRVRVYHLPTDSNNSTTMDDARRTSSSTSTTVVSDNSLSSSSFSSSSPSRPPPLPLSTSSFAFDRPSLSEDELPSGHDDDASSIAFIHQPNPDYGGGDDEATELPTTTDMSIADVVAGEILANSSETDSAPIDWGHHTQVYGGGVCLACLAAESSGGEGGEGGEYGESVRMEDRR